MFFLNKSNIFIEQQVIILWFCLFKSICGINIMLGVFITFTIFYLFGRKHIVLRPQPFENSSLWFRWNPEFLNIDPRNSNNLLKWLDLISVCCCILSSWQQLYSPPAPDVWAPPGLVPPSDEILWPSEPPSQIELTIIVLGIFDKRVRSGRATATY